jgi:hypothetical protein
LPEIDRHYFQMHEKMMIRRYATQTKYQSTHFSCSFQTPIHNIGLLFTCTIPNACPKGERHVDAAKYYPNLSPTEISYIG